MEKFEEVTKLKMLRLWFEEDDIMEILWALDTTKTKSPRTSELIYRIARILGLSYPHGQISWSDNRRVMGNEPHKRVKK